MLYAFLWQILGTKDRPVFSWDRMTVEEIVRFLLSLVPYLNAGTITLIISIGLERLGFKITRREFKREPLKSLFWGFAFFS